MSEAGIIKKIRIRVEDTLSSFIADRLPRKVIYYCLIRACVFATEGREDSHKVSFDFVIRKWEI